MGTILPVIAGAPLTQTQSEEQLITIDPEATRPYRLRFRGTQTAEIAVTATDEQIQNALNALKPLKDNIEVSGSIGGPFNLYFENALADQPVELIQSNRPEVVVSRTTAGYRETGHGLPKGALLASDEPHVYLNTGDEADPHLIPIDPPPGSIITQGLSFAENAGAGIYNGTLPLYMLNGDPLLTGLLLRDVIVVNLAPWAADTAVMDVGDTLGGYQSFIAGLDLKGAAMTPVPKTLNWQQAAAAIGTYDDVNGPGHYYSSQPVLTARIVTTGAGGNTGRARVYAVYSPLPTLTPAVKA